MFKFSRPARSPPLALRLLAQSPPLAPASGSRDSRAIAPTHTVSGTRQCLTWPRRTIVHSALHTLGLGNSRIKQFYRVPGYSMRRANARGVRRARSQLASPHLLCLALSCACGLAAASADILGSGANSSGKHQ